MNDLISVIIPVYNSERYVEDCIKSLQAQTYTKLEIILVDDGSKDDSLKICEEIAKSDSRIRVYHKENGGVASARNYGIRVSHGQFIGFMDNDDYIEPDMYETLYNELCKSDCYIAQILVEDVTESRQQIGEVVRQNSYIEEISAHDFKKGLLLQTGNLTCWSKLFRRGVLEEYQFVDGRWNEDVLLLYRIFSDPKYSKILSVDKIGYHYVQRKGSYSKNGFNQGYVDNLKNALLFIESEKEPDLAVCAERLYFHQLIPFYLFVNNRYKKDNYDEYCAFLRPVKTQYRKWRVNSYLSRKEKLLLFGMKVFPNLMRKSLEILNYKGYFR